MDVQVLVAFATKYGATAEIADKIGQVLRESGLPADVLPVDSVGDLTRYDAVVLGSAVYAGRINFNRSTKLWVFLFLGARNCNACRYKCVLPDTYKSFYVCGWYFRTSCRVVGHRAWSDTQNSGRGFPCYAKIVKRLNYRRYIVACTYSSNRYVRGNNVFKFSFH